MSGAELRVGVIGTGIMGADHARILHRFVSGAALTRLADVDPERAAAVAAGIPGAQVSADAQALVADPEVDAVLIASSDATHAEYVLAATRAGKPTLCEKPLAPTLAESADVAGTLAAEGTTDLLSLGFMRRFDPAYVALKAAVDAGGAGVPLAVHCVARGVASGPGATSESSVTGSAVHEFDIVPWLLGSPVVAVSWHAPRRSRDVSPGAPDLQDPQVMLLRTADGVLTTLETYLNARYGYDIRCEVVVERAALQLAAPALVVSDAAGSRSTGWAADWRPRFEDAYRLELQAWVDGVRTGATSALATARDGLVASAVAEAAIASMHDGGRWVDVTVPEVAR